MNIITATQAHKLWLLGRERQSRIIERNWSAIWKVSFLFLHKLNQSVRKHSFNGLCIRFKFCDSNREGEEAHTTTNEMLLMKMRWVTHISVTKTLFALRQALMHFFFLNFQLIEVLLKSVTGCSTFKNFICRFLVWRINTNEPSYCLQRCFVRRRLQKKR